MVGYVSTDSLKMLKTKQNFVSDSSTIVLSSAYLAPIEYYAIMHKHSNVIIEQNEYYEKQSYRNRCRILTANGVMDLCIPVINSGKSIMRDIGISEHDDWQLKHWRAIETAYNSSPFFEYYQDDLKPFYLKKWKYLLDFNQELQNTILSLLDLKMDIKLSEEYVKKNDELMDCRNVIHPKKKTEWTSKRYYQVFEQKFGFTPQLSIIDLLFNMGPESEIIIGY